MERWLWRLPHWAHFAIAVALSLAAIWARYFLADDFQGRAPLTLSTIAVLGAAFAGGFWPGLVAASISVAFGTFVYIAPEGPDHIWTQGDVLLILVTLFTWIALCWLCHKLRSYTIASQSSFEMQSVETAQLTATLDSITDGYFSVDKKLNVILANTSLMKMLRREGERLEGKNIVPVLEDFLEPGLVTLIKSVTARRVSDRIDLAGRDGRHYYHIRVYPGEDYGVFAFVQDISDRKSLELAQDRMLAVERTARAAAEHSSQVKDEFLATLSHELRTPLTTLLGWIELIKSRERLTGTMQEAFDAIVRSSGRLTQLIDELLDLGRINAGKVSLDIRHLKATDVINDAVNTAQPLAAVKDIKLSAEILGPDIYLRADKGRLMQICSNLINNAVKFTPDNGSVLVTLAKEDVCGVIRVSDDGEGIEASMLPVIFERFRQVNSSPTRRHEGLGLGLAIVKQLVDLHKGTIEVASEGLGRGTCFTVRLPLSSEVPEEGDQDDGALNSSDQTALEGILVMVVEDDDGTREMLRIMLEQHGAIIEACPDAQHALDKLKQMTPDLILSDIGMPIMDGYEFMRQVRREIGGPNVVPAIALTAFARAEDRKNAIESGFQEFMTKPIMPKDLLATVSKLTVEQGR